MQNEIVDRRQIDRSNAYYMIEGMAKALDLDVTLFQSDVEFNFQVHNVRYLFEHKKKSRVGKKATASLILLSLSPIFYLVYIEFSKVGQIYSLSMLMVLQIISMGALIIGLIFYRVVTR